MNRCYCSILIGILSPLTLHSSQEIQALNKSIPKIVTLEKALEIQETLLNYSNSTSHMRSQVEHVLNKLSTRVEKIYKKEMARQDAYIIGVYRQQHQEASAFDASVRNIQQEILRLASLMSDLKEKKRQLLQEKQQTLIPYKQSSSHAYEHKKTIKDKYARFVGAQPTQSISEASCYELPEAWLIDCEEKVVLTTPPTTWFSWLWKK